MRKLLSMAILAAAIFVSCNSSNTNTKPLVVATADATEKFQCPMKCQGDTAYTTAGKCPVCKMDLKKMEANHEHHPNDSTHTNH